MQIYARFIIFNRRTRKLGKSYLQHIFMQHLIMIKIFGMG
jgi:hypothetical protein